MAIEPAPVEINLREPRKSGRDFSTLLWLCGWGVATAVALSALALTSQTQTATDRLRSIFAVSEPSGVAQMPPRIAQLELETQMLTEQVRALNADRDRLAGRIAVLQSSVDDMTGAIKRQAAATAAVLAARAAAPASQTQPSIAPPVAGATPVAELLRSLAQRLPGLRSWRRTATDGMGAARRRRARGEIRHRHRLLGPERLECSVSSAGNRVSCGRRCASAPQGARGATLDPAKGTHRSASPRQPATAAQPAISS